MMARSTVITLVFAALIFGAAILALPACAGVMGWFNMKIGFCPIGVTTLDETIAGERRQQEILLGRIARLEAELSALECTPQQTNLTPPAGQPDFAEDSAEQRRFDDRDISVLDGCWQLQHTLRFTNRESGAETSFDQWQMCFDAEGNGSQSMRSADGRVVCEGVVPGDFNSSGSLVIIEPGNLLCNDGTFIYRRDITCDIDANGFLACQARQPEINLNNEPFRMQREQ